MADAGGLQLLPDTRKKIEVRTPGENRMLIFGFLSLALMGGIYFGLTTYISGLNEEVEALGGQISALEDRRNKKAEQELSGLSKQAKLIKGVLDNHTFFTKGFSKIESVLHPKVELDSMQVSATERKISFSFIAQSYTDLARQLSAFLSGDGIIDATIGKITSQNNGRVESNVSLEIDSNKYFKK